MTKAFVRDPVRSSAQESVSASCIDYLIDLVVLLPSVPSKENAGPFRLTEDRRPVANPNSAWQMEECAF
ncbi:hypothetical protein OUZ56_031170 [Daphnia magna]|uniref:Uncharacterized protein n=1 Tax=Daphnia magna TaxID=35525 RepID=A0ABQ9ZTH3_9CRUS|nr:hypothetical protein OUZ56_031170 [Daphnia magna]